MDEKIFNTENPNVKIVQRAKDGNLETLRQITATTGEVSQTNGDTVETITITRTLLTTLS